MKLNTNSEKVELGFQTPAPGTYIFEVAEGVNLFTNENSGKTSLKIPTKIMDVVDGDNGSVGLPVTHFVPIRTNMGEEQVRRLLTITGLALALEKRFPDEMEFTDPRFIDAVKLKLPGKLFKGVIEINENNAGKKFANFTSWEKLEKQKNQVIADQGPAVADSDGEDW